MGPGGAVTAVTGQSMCSCAHTMSRQPQWRHGSTQWSRVVTRPGRPDRWAARAGGDAVADLRASVAKVNDNPIRSEAGLVSATLSCGAVSWQARDTLLSAVARARTCHRAKARGVGTIEVEVP